jgi:DNA-binding MarR family transcriptional regulator
LTTTVLAEEAHIPLTTAIRRLDTLAEHGLIARRQDGSDRRRTLVELSDVGIEALDKFFEQFSD